MYKIEYPLPFQACFSVLDWSTFWTLMFSSHIHLCVYLTSFSTVIRSKKLSLHPEFTWRATVALNCLTKYTVKIFNDFPVPSRDVTNQTLPGQEQLNYSRPGRVWLVTSQLGTGKAVTFLLQCRQILPNLLGSVHSKGGLFNKLHPPPPPWWGLALCLCF